MSAKCFKHVLIYFCEVEHSVDRALGLDLGDLRSLRDFGQVTDFYDTVNIVRNHEGNGDYICNLAWAYVVDILPSYVSQGHEEL